MSENFNTMQLSFRRPDRMTCLSGITALKIKTAFYYVIFSHPDCTVGFGIAPNHAFRLAGLPLQEYRRWGIAPRPEESLFYLFLLH